MLDARAKHPGKSLAWLYNPETLPKNLQNAHDLVDDAVDEAYGYDKGNDDTSRVAYLFEQYEKLTQAQTAIQTSLLPPDPPAKPTKTKKAAKSTAANLPRTKNTTTNTTISDNSSTASKVKPARTTSSASE